MSCIRACSTYDKHVYLQNKVQEVQRAKTPQQPRLAWESLHTQLAFGGKESKFSRSVQALTDSTGKQLSDPVSIDNSKLTFFGAAECTDLCSIEDFVHTSNNTSTPIPSALDINSVPDLCSVESFYRNVKKGEAPRIDGVPNDV